MARLQHVVLYADDVDEAAKFYDGLGLKRVVDGADQFGRIICFSDGHVNWTLMPVIEGRKAGVDHLGFLVDDVEEAAAAMVDAGGAVAPTPILDHALDEESGLPPGSAQVTLTDRAGVRIELATSPWPA